MSDNVVYDINEIREKLRAYLNKEPNRAVISAGDSAYALLFILDFLHERFGAGIDLTQVELPETDEELERYLVEIFKGEIVKIPGIARQSISKGNIVINDGNDWRNAGMGRDVHYSGVALISAAPGQPIIVAKRKGD